MKDFLLKKKKTFVIQIRNFLLNKNFCNSNKNFSR